MSKAVPKEIQFANPHVQQITNEKRFAALEAGTGLGSSKSGLTDSAQQEQASASDRLKRQRKAFRTVYAGETGNVVKSDKLGITGGI